MNPIVLKTLHIAGALGAFTALGAVIAGSCEKCRKAAAILHGISLLLLIGIGLHMVFAFGYNGTGGWWHAKVALWLVLGAAPALAKRKVVPAPALMGLCLAVGVTAAYLGLAKPF